MSISLINIIIITLLCAGIAFFYILKIKRIKSSYEEKQKYKTTLPGLETPDRVDKDSIIEEQKKQIEHIEDKYRNMWKTSLSVHKQKEVVENLNAELDEQTKKLELAYKNTSAKNAKLWRTSLLVNKQKEEVENIRLQLATKNKDMTDSIEYAAVIQQSILTPLEKIEKALPESFILFKPKDIVSGDFYFFAEVKKDIILAACDCTGHGVPGAFMSMLSVRLLDEIVNDKSVNDAAEVLNQLSGGIIHAFGEAGATGARKEGMDVALCIFQYKENDSVVLQYAGANNPLYIMKKDGSELIEIKPDKQAIGYNTGEQKLFTNHNIQLQKGDTFYISSDGYRDQFGGPQGKKFKTKQFKQLLLSISARSIKEQKEIIDHTYLSWRGELIQVDDILVIGVRI